MVRLFGHYIPRILVGLTLAEILIFFLAFQLAILVRFDWSWPQDETIHTLVTNGLMFATVMSAATIAMGLYQRSAHERVAGFSVRLGLSFAMGTTLLSLIFYLFPTIFMGRGVLGLSLIFAFVGILLARAAFLRVADANTLKRRLLIVGAGAHAERLEELTKHNGGLGFVVAGYLPLSSSEQRVPDSRLMHPNRPLVDLVIEHGIDEIVVAADDRRGRLPVTELLDCRMSGFEVIDLPSFYEKELALIKTDALSPNWIIFSQRGFRVGITGLYGKRLLDLTLASLMLLLASPVMVLAAIASLIESRGRDPILYHQIRVGESGKLFKIHKFRSMRIDAEADGIARWAEKNDSRITRFGALIRQTRIDELPQLFNVLKGQMSLVGPRPERPDFVEQLTVALPYYGERHRVKPGVTGWAQLLYPYGSGIEDARRKLEYDLYYVKHAGIILDLIILLQTVEVVLLGKGAR